MLTLVHDSTSGNFGPCTTASIDSEDTIRTKINETIASRKKSYRGLQLSKLQASASICFDERTQQFIQSDTSSTPPHQQAYPVGLLCFHAN